MNNKQEKNFLEHLEKSLSAHDRGMIKQQRISWALLILGFLIAFGFQVYAGYKPEAEMHSGIYILAGCFIGFGWNLNLSTRMWPYLAKHLNRQSIRERISELNI